MLSTEDQDKLADLELRLRCVIDSIAGNHWWKDKNGVYRGCNAAVLNELGVKSEADLIGKTDHELPWASNADQLVSHDKKVMELGIPFRGEERVVTALGTIKIFDVTKVPLRDKKGNIIGTIGNSVDITAKKELEQARHASHLAEEKTKQMQLMASVMAHELRTPLAAIKFGSLGIKDHLPNLLATYELAREHNLPVKAIPRDLLATLHRVLQGIIIETDYANSVINMFLVNTTQAKINASEFQPCSINQCIKLALARYPFFPDEKQLVEWRQGEDFTFTGTELLTEHILFNLLKNALYYVKAAGKGKVELWTSKEENYNKLCFKDTGKGVCSNILPKIFDQFFTNTHHGTGIGLAFCKMVMQAYGGNILCDSTEGEYTQFTLLFPNFFHHQPLVENPKRENNEDKI